MLKGYNIILNVMVVLSTQCHMMLKGYVIMLKNPDILFMFMLTCCKRVILLNACFMSTNCLILLKGYAIMLKFRLSGL